MGEVRPRRLTVKIGFGTSAEADFSFHLILNQGSAIHRRLILCISWLVQLFCEFIKKIPGLDQGLAKMPNPDFPTCS